MDNLSEVVKRKAEDDIDLIQTLLVKEVESYLQEEALAMLKPKIRELAVNAVAQWAEIKTSLNPYMEVMNLNVNVTFVEKVLNKIVQASRINITVKDKDEH